MSLVCQTGSSPSHSNKCKLPVRFKRGIQHENQLCSSSTNFGPNFSFGLCPFRPRSASRLLRRIRRKSSQLLWQWGAMHQSGPSNSNHLFTRQLRPGDCFVFPKGLIHYLYNMDKEEAALAISGFSSQNPGLQISSSASFTSNPGIPDEVLEKTFKIHGPDVAKIRRSLGG
ncbi:unnamed protein product [Coffea canephora]|uniref:Germin-like protein n=1 Tax=Coffea canephora TaxID=49390 RepID=A0A068TW49_COFCA|nr:unnamed protein product [Coffea canephora]